jgi:beta-1,4-mannosyl-glycoprotein beta-1,4-N-acetylglucosaminyltransferase
MIVDVFTYNGEADILEIRLNILDQVVDQFIIVEATETFSGSTKPLYYEKEKARFEKWAHKIKYHIVRPPYSEGIVALANGSPNVTDWGRDHWHREFCQKETIKEALTHLQDEDVVFIGDVDEIWADRFEPDEEGVFKLALRVYTYYLNNRSSEQFHGTICTRYRNIKDKCLNHLRSSEHYKVTGSYWGWHFTSQGGYEEVKRKLSDSYTTETYWNPAVQSQLESNIRNSKDFLGRGFIFEEDERDWPQYLKDNKKKYAHLLR